MTLYYPRGEEMNEWNGFQGETWKKKINVEDFIINNYQEYTGNEKFLVKSSKKTAKVWSRCQKLLEKETITKVLDIDTHTIAGIDNFDAGYIDKKNEVIVGLQTDEPLKRMMNPFGGIDTVKEAVNSYGYTMDKEIEDKFFEYHKTYQEGILDAYSDEMLKYRKAKVLASLPEEYGRGKILGDYRRLALYGVDYLIKRKKKDLQKLTKPMNFAMIRTREEVQEQIKALEDIKWMASRYGMDISRPASNAKEAVQWLYFAYLSTIKQNNGAINSFGRNAAFLDIYIERDLASGTLTEEGAQELIDQLVIKLRLVRHLRKNDYRDTLIGEPAWVSESIGGMCDENKSFVTKTAYRFLNTLKNLDSSPEPNFVILWSQNLPETFQKYVSKLAIDTHVIQFVNDDIIRPIYGRDYAITGCSSPVKLGSQMVYYGASINLPKALLYAIHGGKDEMTREVMVDGIPEIEGDKLNYKEVIQNFLTIMNHFIRVYVDALSVVHYMQDKYGYESAPMAFLDTVVERKMSFGVTGLATVADSLSAIRYGGVKVIRDQEGFITGYQVEKEFPRFGNREAKVDSLASDIMKLFAKALSAEHLYRNANARVSLQTMADHVFYGEATGATPDGREEKEPFSPGASPSDGMDISGAGASLESVAKIPYAVICEDGITNNFCISPNALGEKESERVTNLLQLIHDYFKKGGEHLNINVLSKNQLFNAQKNPDKNPKLIVRYAECGVRFNQLTRGQQEELLSRTFHEDL